MNEQFASDTLGWFCGPSSECYEKRGIFSLVSEKGSTLEFYSYTLFLTAYEICKNINHYCLSMTGSWMNEGLLFNNIVLVDKYLIFQICLRTKYDLSF